MKDLICAQAPGFWIEQTVSVSIADRNSSDRLMASPGRYPVPVGLTRAGADGGLGVDGWQLENRARRLLLALATWARTGLRTPSSSAATIAIRRPCSAAEARPGSGRDHGPGGVGRLQPRLRVAIMITGIISHGAGPMSQGHWY